MPPAAPQNERTSRMLGIASSTLTETTKTRRRRLPLPRALPGGRSWCFRPYGQGPPHRHAPQNLHNFSPWFARSGPLGSAELLKAHQFIHATYRTRPPRRRLLGGRRGSIIMEPAHDHFGVVRHRIHHSSSGGTAHRRLRSPGEQREPQRQSHPARRMLAKAARAKAAALIFPLSPYQTHYDRRPRRTRRFRATRTRRRSTAWAPATNALGMTVAPPQSAAHSFVRVTPAFAPLTDYDAFPSSK